MTDGLLVRALRLPLVRRSRGVRTSAAGPGTSRNGKRTHDVHTGLGLRQA